MCTRAGLSRAVTMFAALLLMAVASHAPAREWRAADTQSENYPTVQALRFMGRLTRRDPAADALIERIRKVE